MAGRQSCLIPETELLRFLTMEMMHRAKGVIRHFAFATDDVDACVEVVKAAGYEVFIEPKDIEIASTPVFPARIAFCKGPLGEEIELFEEK